MKKSTIFLMVVLAFSMLMFGCQAQSSESKKEKQELLADIKLDGGYSVRIENKNTSVWYLVTFTINDQYTYSTDWLDPGKSTIVELVKFAKPEGERFNYITHAIKKFSIKCTMNDEICSDSWKPKS